MSRAPTARASAIASSASARDSVEPRAEHQDLGEPGERPGPRLGRRLGRDQAHRRPVALHGELALAGDPSVAAEALVQQARRGSGPPASSTRRIAAWTWVTARAGSWYRATPAERGEEVDPVATRARLGIGDPIPEVDRALVLGEGLGKA